jgi:hypothetical protein
MSPVATAMSPVATAIVPPRAHRLRWSSISFGIG